jgi:hypothetical protein
MKLIVQAIAFSELSKPARAGLIASALADARALRSQHPDIGVEELAVDIAVSFHYIRC